MLLYPLCRYSNRKLMWLTDVIPYRLPTISAPAYCAALAHCHQFHIECAPYTREGVNNKNIHMPCLVPTGKVLEWADARFPHHATSWALVEKWSSVGSVSGWSDSLGSVQAPASETV